MKKTTLLLLTALFIALGTDAATGRYRQKLTFDQDWNFRLCKDREEVKRVLNSLEAGRTARGSRKESGENKGDTRHRTGTGSGDGKRSDTGYS